MRGTDDGEGSTLGMGNEEPTFRGTSEMNSVACADDEGEGWRL